jgi:hypothetical protein
MIPLISLIKTGLTYDIDTNNAYFSYARAKREPERIMRVEQKSVTETLNWVGDMWLRK